MPYGHSESISWYDLSLHWFLSTILSHINGNVVLSLFWILLFLLSSGPFLSLLFTRASVCKSIPDWTTKTSLVWSHVSENEEGSLLISCMEYLPYIGLPLSAWFRTALIWWVVVLLGKVNLDQGGPTSFLAGTRIVFLLDPRAKNPYCHCFLHCRYL